MSTLGRVLDPEELDRAEGPRGKLVVDVLEEWMAAGDAVEVVVPRRVTCARCDGGGCDECGRSGALRFDDEDDARTVTLALPEQDAVVRLVRPLGESAGLEQLLVEVRHAPVASAFVRRLPKEAPSSVSRPVARTSASLVILLVLAVTIAVFLSLR